MRPSRAGAFLFLAVFCYQAYQSKRPADIYTGYQAFPKEGTPKEGTAYLALGHMEQGKHPSDFPCVRKIRMVR